MGTVHLQLLDVELIKLTDAVAASSPQPRHARWAHLSLCVLDATYSIGLRYNAVVVPVVRRYATKENLTPALIEGEQLQEQISPREGEQSLTQFAASIEDLSDEEFAEALGSRNRTLSRGGMLKSAASRRVAHILVANRVEILDDDAELLADAGRAARVEEQLRQVSGAGTQGIRTS